MTTLADYFLEQGREEGIEQGRVEGSITTAVNAVKNIVASTGINTNQAFEAITSSLSARDKAVVRKQLGL